MSSKNLSVSVADTAASDVAKVPNTPPKALRPPQVRRHIDWKVLLVAVGFVAVLSGGLYFLHATMVDRNADALLSRATVEEKKGNFDEAASHVARYLRLRPNDVDALERLAGLLRKSSHSRQGWEEILATLEHVLRLEPDRHEVRHTAAETALMLRRYGDAEKHLAALFGKQPQLATDRDLMLGSARAAAALGELTSKRGAYSRYLVLIDTHPGVIAAYTELADLLRSKPSDVPLRSTVEAGNRSWNHPELLQLFPEKPGAIKAEALASNLLDRMVQNGEPRFEAYLARASDRNVHGDRKGASADLQQALEEKGGRENSRTYVVAASIELGLSRDTASSGDTEAGLQHRAAARRYAEQGLQLSSPDPTLHLLLAEATLEWQSDRQRSELLLEAERHLKDGLAQVEVARKQLQPGDFEEAEELLATEIKLRWTLADTLIDRLVVADDNSTEEETLRRLAKQELASLRAIGCRTELIDMLGARLQLENEDPLVAIDSLEKARVALVAFPDLRKRIDLLLGEAYRKVNNPDRRVETFRRAVADDVAWTQGRVLLAKALADSGRTDEAIQQYKLLSNEPETALELARLTLTREWQKPVAERNLAAVDQLLASAEGSDSVAPRLALLRAQRAMAAGDMSAAEATLAESTERFTDEISLWQASVALQIQRDDLAVDQRIARAEDLIRAAKERFQDQAELRLAKIEVARLRGTEALRAELTAQMESATELKEAERVELLENLVRYTALTKEPKRAEAIWRAILKDRPAFIPAWLAIATLAIEAQDESEWRLALEKIREIEGKNGPNGNYVEAAWKLRKISEDKTLYSNDAVLAEMRRLLQPAADARPRWAAPRRLLGLVETMAASGKVDRVAEEKAFAHFQRAFQLGDRSVQTIRAIVDYLHRRGSLEAADAVIQQVERESPEGISGELARTAAQIALDHERIDAAIEWTRRAGSSESGLGSRLDYGNLVFFKYQSLPEDAKRGAEGQKLLAEARSIFREAVDAAPDKPETWHAYIVHFWRVGDKETALAAIEEAKTKLPAEPVSHRLASLAQYYEVVQLPGEAARHYRLAVEADPSDPLVRRVAAAYFFRAGQLSEANVHLDYLLDPKNKAPEFAATWARRSRALTLAASGRKQDVQLALSMLRESSQSAEEAAADLRLQLVVLSGQSTLQDRRDRIYIYEKLQAIETLTEAEKLLLGSLYTQTGMWEKARAIYRQLLADDAPSAVVLSEYLAASLKQETAEPKLEEVLKPRLSQLRTLEPNTIRTAITTARFEHAFGRDEAAAKALTDHAARMESAESPGETTVTAVERVELRMAAEAAEELRLFEAAHTLFAAIAQHAERPEDALVFATYLGRQGRYAEALDVCDRFSEKALPDALAVAAVNSISTGAAPADQVARAEKLVLAAQAANPQSIRIRTALGGLRSIQGQLDEAEQLYRQVLAEQPEDVSVMNNLAWQLALTGSRLDEALRLVNDAIKVSGPLAALLDTRGTVELARKDVKRAITDLEAAYADTPTPYIAFHLALAYTQAGNFDAAREHLRAAHQGGLSIQELHPSELETYRLLLAKLGMPSGEI